MAGVSYAARQPRQRKSRTSAVGLAKLALIKSRANKADQHCRRALEVIEMDPTYDVSQYLNAIRNVLSTITDLCEEESNEHG